jgi:hypothetical protein
MIRACSVPAVLIAEIHDEMKAIMRQFADIAASLGLDLADEVTEVS